jgi:uncharacterized RDD family membrane protein YckC
MPPHCGPEPGKNKLQADVSPNPHNLQGQYAGFISRLLALAIDLAIISLTFIVITWFVSITANMLQLRSFLEYVFNNIPGSENFIEDLFGLNLASYFTLPYFMLYFILFWSLTGQTPGMALLGLRVMTLEGKRLSIWRGILRMIGYILSTIPLYLGFLWVLVDDRRQGWHDKLAGTCVIYTWEAQPDERFLAEEIRKLTGIPRRLRTRLHPSQDQPSDSR